MRVDENCNFVGGENSQVLYCSSQISKSLCYFFEQKKFLSYFEKKSFFFSIQIFLLLGRDGIHLI
jgi:hypothetical protein